MWRWIDYVLNKLPERLRNGLVSDGKLRSGHQVAGLALTLELLVYVVMGWVLRPDKLLPEHEPRAARPAARPPFEAHAHRVAAVGVLDRLERAVEDLAALVDHEDEVAHLLGDGHVVRREDDRRAVLASGRGSPRAAPRH